MNFAALYAQIQSHLDSIKNPLHRVVLIAFSAKVLQMTQTLGRLGIDPDDIKNTISLLNTLTGEAVRWVNENSHLSPEEAQAALEQLDAEATHTRAELDYALRQPAHVV